MKDSKVKITRKPFIITVLHTALSKLIHHAQFTIKPSIPTYEHIASLRGSSHEISYQLSQQYSHATFT